MSENLILTNEYRKNFFVKIFECIIAGALILSCNTMWVTLAPNDYKIKNLALILVLIGVLGAVLFSKRMANRKVFWTSFIMTAAIAAILIIFILVTRFSERRFVKDAVVFLALLFYYLLVEYKDKIPAVLRYYSNIVAVIAAVSLVCWLVFSIFKLIPPSGTELTWWNGTDHYTDVTSYYGIYFEPQMKWVLGEYIARNCSIFTEAPMAALHFSIAFLFNLFLKKKNYIIYAVILGLAVLTTFSATGYIICAIAIVAKLILGITGTTKYRTMTPATKRMLKVIFLVFIIAVIVVCVIIFSRRAGGQSWNIRIEDFRATFQAWFDKPIFGNGIYNFDAVKAHFEGARATYAGFSCTNSLGTILADGGIVFGCLYIGSFICAMIKAIKNREYNVLVFAVLAFIIFAVTIVAYDYIIMFIFIFFGAYKSVVKEKLENKLFSKEADNR